MFESQCSAGPGPGIMINLVKMFIVSCNTVVALPCRGALKSNIHVSQTTYCRIPQAGGGSRISCDMVAQLAALCCGQFLCAPPCPEKKIPQASSFHCRQPLIPRPRAHPRTLHADPLTSFPTCWRTLGSRAAGDPGKRTHPNRWGPKGTGNSKEADVS